MEKSQFSVLTREHHQYSLPERLISFLRSGGESLGFQCLRKGEFANFHACSLLCRIWLYDNICVLSYCHHDILLLPEVPNIGGRRLGEY